MRRALIWATLAFIGFIAATFLLYIRPAFVELRMRREAESIAEIIASEISFLSTMREHGAISGRRVVKVWFPGRKRAEIMIYDSSKEVVVRVIAGDLETIASSKYHSEIPVVSPPKVYDGTILLVLYYDSNLSSFAIAISNLAGGG